MKSARYACVASFALPCSTVIRYGCRFSSVFIVRESIKFKKLSSSYYTHRHESHKALPMVVAGYPPPLFSIAPMMDWTDNHYRTLARLISKHAWLYTEMLVPETIAFQKDNLDRFLAFSPKQHPIVLQIGGNNLENIAKAAQLASSFGYDEINLNCGCPSPKVAGHGCFGVRLMLDPKVILYIQYLQHPLRSILSFIHGKHFLMALVLLKIVKSLHLSMSTILAWCVTFLT